MKNMSIIDHQEQLHNKTSSDALDKDLDLINQIFAPNELNDSGDNQVIGPGLMLTELSGFNLNVSQNISQDMASSNHNEAEMVQPPKEHKS